MTNYYVDEAGNYLGGFCGCTPPDGAIEIPSPPEHGLDVLDRKTGQWDTSRRPVPKPTKADLKTQLAGANSIAGLRSVIADMLEGMA